MKNRTFMECIGLALLVGGTPDAASVRAATIPASAQAQNVLQEADSLIQQGREHGLAFMSSNDKDTKNRSKDSLKDARKLLEKALKQNKGCQACMEKIVEIYFYEAYFKFEKNYEKCIANAEEGMERFPDSTELAYFHGYANYNEGNFLEATQSLTYYLDMGTPDPQTLAEAQRLLEESQKQFLSGWYNQADFYESNESRITMFNPQTYQNQTIFQVTPQWELDLGAQGFQQLTAQMAKMEDPEIQGYLEELVSRLVEKTPGPGFDYKVTVVDSPEINAITPPGHIIVYTGLLAFSDSESQLAGVMAHEIAHNHAHHQARAVIKSFQAQAVVNMVTQAINPQSQWAQFMTQLGSNIGTQIFMRAYSRFEEREADLYGAHIMFNAGYNPTSASSFFLKLFKRHPQQPVKFLSTHPPTPDRVDYLTDYLESFPLDREMRLDSEAFQNIKARLTPQPTTSKRDALPPRDSRSRR